MSLDPQGRRADGVRPISPSELSGSRGADGDGVVLPTTTYQNPGPTPNMRGIEPNTALMGSTTTPEATQTFGAEVPRGEVWQAPDSSGRNAALTSNSVWGSADSSAKNSHVLVLPADAFSAMGETYPANGGLDGES